MREQLEDGEPREYLAIACTAIQDSDNNCRWQSLIVVGEFIPFAPEAVWRIASRYAESRSEDMRMAVAVLLLEHLLEYDFDTYFHRIVRRIAAGSKYLRSMLPWCGGLTPGQQARVTDYLKNAPHNNQMQLTSDAARAVDAARS